jgi:N-acetyltransferase
MGLERDNGSGCAPRQMAIDFQPHLKGDLVELRPLRREDWDDLFAVASDPLIWEQHPAHDRYQEDVFRVFFNEGLECGGGFAILNKETRQIIGSTRFYGYDAEKSEIEIGWTFLARRYWGGHYNREVKQLMLRHAFLFVETVVFKVGENNMRSRKALEKIGAVLSGREASIVRYVITKPG